MHFLSISLSSLEAGVCVERVPVVYEKCKVFKKGVWHFSSKAKQLSGL